MSACQCSMQQMVLHLWLLLAVVAMLCSSSKARYECWLSPSLASRLELLLGKKPLLLQLLLLVVLCCLMLLLQHCCPLLALLLLQQQAVLLLLLGCRESLLLLKHALLLPEV